MRVQMIMGEEWVHIDDVFDYVMQNDYESVCEAVMDNEGQAQSDMRSDMD